MSKPTKPFCIADRPHLENLFALLMVTGVMCPKCEHGTRKTSKNWRRCKQCGERLHLEPATKELVAVNTKAVNTALKVR